MYHWIRLKLPEKYAVPVSALLYAVMILFVLYFSFEKRSRVQLPSSVT